MLCTSETGLAHVNRHCHGIIYSGIHYLLLIYYRLLVHLGKEKKKGIETMYEKFSHE